MAVTCPCGGIGAVECLASLDMNGQERLRTELAGLWSALKATDGNTEYLEVIATRCQKDLDVADQIT
jgi:hypothetical protein